MRTRALSVAFGLAAAAAASLAFFTGGVEPAPAADSLRFYLTTAEIEQMRANVAEHEWARLAWAKTKARADAALDDAPQPADPSGDYSAKGPTDCPGSVTGWYCELYLPGLEDGRKAHSLAIAFAITGEPRYAHKAKEFVLAWTRTYNPPAERVGHMVAEPVGFMLKGFMTYDVVRDVFTAGEQTEVREWARHFVARGKAQADGARDDPWSPEAPYGNSATWARALAVAAAAVVGEPDLSATLAWNWAHATPHGKDYGWLHLLENSMGTSGQMVEEPLRKSIGYGLYAWYPLALIADIARHVGFEHDLWRARTASGKSLYSPVEYYAPYLTEKKGDPYAGAAGCCYASYATVLSQYRAAMEVAYKALPASAVLREIVTHGGEGVRGSNVDPHITSWNAVTGELSLGG